MKSGKYALQPSVDRFPSDSEFIRRTALKEAERVIKNNKNQDGEYCEK